MYQGRKGNDWHGVMDNVGHFYSAWDLFENVLVVPERIRAAPLLIDKEVGFPHVRNFGDPLKGNVPEGL